MAAKKKKKTKKPVKAKKAPAKTSKKAAKKTVKKTRKTVKKKTVKAAAKKASAKKAPAKKAGASTRARATKKKAPAKKKQIVGEGDYAASRKFDADQAGFVAKNKAKIPAMAKEAEKALDGPEGDSLRDAEAAAAGRSRDTF
jgi:hypothetical protein